MFWCRQALRSTRTCPALSRTATTPQPATVGDYIQANCPQLLTAPRAANCLGNWNSIMNASFYDRQNKSYTPNPNFLLNPTAAPSVLQNFSSTLH